MIREWRRSAITKNEVDPGRQAFQMTGVLADQGQATVCIRLLYGLSMPSLCID